jgi:hypothetical protein
LGSNRTSSFDLLRFSGGTSLFDGDAVVRQKNLSDRTQPDPGMQIAEQHDVGEAVIQEKPRYPEAASYVLGGRRTCTLENVLNAQAMLTHAGDDLNDRRVSLGQPLLMLAFTFSGLPALFLAVIGLGECSAHLIHQLPEALVSHRHIGKSSVLLGGFSASKALVCKWHLRGLLE